MPRAFGPCDQGAIGRKAIWRNGSAAESPIIRFQAGNGIAKPSRENIFELSRIFGVPLEQIPDGSDSSNIPQLVQETSSPNSVSLVFLAIEARR
jgi:hypothetical protein